MVRWIYNATSYVCHVRVAEDSVSLSELAHRLCTISVSLITWNRLLCECRICIEFIIAILTLTSAYTSSGQQRLGSDNNSIPPKTTLDTKPKTRYYVESSICVLVALPLQPFPWITPQSTYPESTGASAWLSCMRQPGTRHCMAVLLLGTSEHLVNWDKKSKPSYQVQVQGIEFSWSAVNIIIFIGDFDHVKYYHFQQIIHYTNTVYYHAPGCPPQSNWDILNYWPFGATTYSSMFAQIHVPGVSQVFVSLCFES